MTDLLNTENVTITLMPDGGHVTAIHCRDDAIDDMEEFIVQQSIANKILQAQLEEARRSNAELERSVEYWDNLHSASLYGKVNSLRIEAIKSAAGRFRNHFTDHRGYFGYQHIAEWFEEYADSLEVKK